MLPLHTHPSQLPELIPQAIERLGHQDPMERKRAAEFLSHWTGQPFWGARGQRRRQPPDPGEARRMKEQWTQWWEANKDGHKPPTQ